MCMPDSLKIVSSFPFSQGSLNMLREAAQADVLCVADTNELLAHLHEAEILCSYKVTRKWRKLAPQLRWLQAAGAGVDELRPTGILDADSGVIVTTATGIHATTISEYVFGSMLMFNRSWPEMVRLQDRHIWPSSGKWYHLSGRELADQALAIIGLGHIGRRIGELGRAFGMRVLATRRSISEGETDPDVDQLYPMERLHGMIRESDYVVVAAPLTPESNHLIGEEELRVMRPHAYLVNVSRGRVIDEAALIHALQEQWIAGAGLDVTVEEPLPADSPLFSMSNVILTPHISGVSVHYDQRLTALFADNLKRYRAGQPLRNQYDPQRGY